MIAFKGIDAWLPAPRPPLTHEESVAFYEEMMAARRFGALIFLYGTTDPWAAGWRAWGGPK